MNGRIRQLAEQASLYALPGNSSMLFENYHKQYTEKFAELIVRECVKHITDQQDLAETNWQCKDGIHIVYSLAEHFGVEE